MISIITPVYNSSSTIKRAIDSVINQTYKNWELIIVDDYSTDNTLEVISQYKDLRITVIKNIKNIGPGASRNIGINASKGDYITFLDSDDYWDDNLLETLYKAAIKHNADIVSAGMAVEDSKGKLIEITAPDETKVLTGEDKFITFKENTAYKFLNLSLTKRELWNKVTYSNRRLGEDTVTYVKLIYFANNRLTLPYAGYHYVQRIKSIVHSASSVKRLVYCMICAIDVYSFFKRLKYDKQIGKDLDYIWIENLKNLLNTSIGKKDREELANELSEIFCFIQDKVVVQK